LLLGTIADTGERKNEGVAAIAEIFLERKIVRKKIERK
jgi:hypothetical protein